MTHTLTTSKGTFLFVGNAAITDELKHRLETTECKIIGKLSTLTEDQAREVVDGFITTAAFDQKRKVHIEQLRSLMQAERLFVGEKEQRGFGGQDGDSMNDHKEKQSRTFPDWLIIKVN